jgi:hypothetical protein
MESQPPAPTPTREQLEHSLKFKRLDIIGNIVAQAIKWGSAVLIVRYGYLSITSLAGKQTIADILVRFLGSVKVSEGVAYLFGAGGILYGVGERQLRRRNIRRVVKGKNDLERIVHPGRTSSNITESGTTRPGDE